MQNNFNPLVMTQMLLHPFKGIAIWITQYSKVKSSLWMTGVIRNFFCKFLNSNESWLKCYSILLK